MTRIARSPEDEIVPLGIHRDRAVLVPVAFAQVQFLGKVWVPRYPEAAAKMPPNTGVAEDYFAPDRPGDAPDIHH